MCTPVQPQTKEPVYKGTLSPYVPTKGGTDYVTRTSPYPQQPQYTPPHQLTTEQKKRQAGFTDVIAPQLGLPAAPPLFAPRIERAAANQQDYVTDSNGVKRRAQTGYSSLRIERS